MVDGFNDDPREIHSIPEIRRFYAAFREAWPYWLYFCNLDSDELRAMVLCCLPSIASVKIDRQPNVAAGSHVAGDRPARDGAARPAAFRGPALEAPSSDLIATLQPRSPPNP